MNKNFDVGNSINIVTSDNADCNINVALDFEETKADVSELSIITLAVDTEYGVRDVRVAKEDGITAYGESIQQLNHGKFLEVLSLGGYSPDLKASLYSDKFDEDYNPIVEILRQKGYEVKTTPVRRGVINKLLTKYYQKHKKRSHKKALEKLKQDKVLKVELNNYGVDLSKIKLSLGEYKGKIEVRFSYPKIDVLLITFFGFADYFKIFGKNWYWLFKEEALLTQFRTVKIQGKMRFSAVVDGVPVDFNIQFFDTRYVFPPRKASLEGQILTYGIADEVGNKVKISEAIKERYGDDVTEKWCKENMGIVKVKYPDIFKEYTIHDAYLTWLLYRKQSQMKVDVGKELGLQEVLTLRETCGSNIQDFLFGLIHKHFIEVEEISDPEKIKKYCGEIDWMYKLGGCKSLSKLYGNDYGRVPLSTVGGLLYTRMVQKALIIGLLLDLDLSSCYATSLTQMSLYIGEPVLSTYHFNKPKLKEVIEELNEINVAKDGWFVRASGKLDKAINTLVLSDLAYKKDKHILEDSKRYAYEENIDDEKDTVNLIDSGKVPEPNDNSKLFSKKINHGIITQATLTTINDLPDEWIEEYLNLEVDCVVYYHPDYTFETLAKANNAKTFLPGNPVVEEMGKGCLKVVSRQVYKNNVCVKFPLADYYTEVKEIRKKLKDAKVPIQEIYKLILNSTYGILASMVMHSNNPVASNWITSCARGAAWRMTLSLNGFNPITDGSSFNWKNIPLGKTLKDILSVNPEYIVEFGEYICNPERLENFLDEIVEVAGKEKANTKGFNNFYKRHLEAFLGKTDWLVDMFDYELKDEKNRLIFTKYANTGAGNYLKAGEWGESFKCRSYQAIPELIEWFKESCNGNYERHVITIDREIIKLSQGSVDAIRILQDADAVWNNEKFRLGIPEDTAEQIYMDGMSHPMGFSKEKFKLMKLVNPSQFVCEDTRQYKALICLCGLCGSISKKILTGNWVYDLDKDYLSQFKAYGMNGKIISPDIDDAFIRDYHEMNKKSPVGIGLELLTYGSQSLNSIQDVRNRIYELLREYKLTKSGVFDLKSSLNFAQRILPRLDDSKYLKHLLAATIILKTNAKIDYIQMLANSTIDPMQRVVFIGDIRQLRYEKKPNWA